MGERDLHQIFLLPRLPKEAVMQLEDKLSGINLPCKVNKSLVDKFYEDINHDQTRIRGATEVRQSKTSTAILIWMRLEKEN